MDAAQTTPQALITEGFSLQFLLRRPRQVAARPKAIILLHGVGNNEQDLFGFANQLPENFLVISPRGPYTPGVGRYAWYEVDFSTGKPVINQAQEKNSRLLIANFIEEIKQAYQVDEIYLGGFSQGAIMSYSVGLTTPGLLRGILSLSGRIPQEIKLEVASASLLAALKIFIAHGVQDTTLSISYAREARTYLQDLGLTPSYHEFEMGHQISKEEIEAMNQWLQA